jgi:hypothetical protein
MNAETLELWEQYVLAVAKNVTSSFQRRNFVAHFGASPRTVVFLWFEFIFPILDAGSDISIVDILWALWFLKSTPPNWMQAGSKFGVDYRTFQGHLIVALDLIDRALPNVR